MKQNQRILHLRHRDRWEGDLRVRELYLRGCGIEELVGSDPIRLEFSASAGKPTPYSDGLVLMVLFYAMERADVLRVEGTLTRRLLRNARQLMEAWHCLVPARFNIICIEASRTEEPALRLTSRGRAISLYSGGVDATFLAMRHADPHRIDGGYALDTVLMVQGMDIAYHNIDGFRRLIDRTAAFRASRGLRLVTVRTDLRRVEFQPWLLSHGAQLAGILNQFGTQFEYGLLGSSEPYNRMIVPWGSMPPTDYLLSGALQVVHEGAGYSRTSKVELVNSDAIARRTVKFCWQGSDVAANCGHCSKCVRTRLNFMAVGNPSPECFAEPFNMGMLDAVRNVTGLDLSELETVLEYAANHAVEGEWLSELTRIVERQRAAA